MLDVNPNLVDAQPPAGCNKSRRRRKRRGVSEPYPPHPELDTDSVFYCGSSTTTKHTQQTLSSFELGESRIESDTTVEYNEELSNPSTPSSSFSFLPGPTPPRCIHQIPSPSLFPFPPPPPPPKRDADRSFCTCPPSLSKHLPIEHEHDHTSPSSSSVSPSVRMDGYIQQVDEDFEVESFERSRGSILLDTSMAGSLELEERGRAKKLAVANREYERTLELLNERAMLLSQLADLKKGRVLR